MVVPVVHTGDGVGAKGFHKKGVRAADGNLGHSLRHPPPSPPSQDGRQHRQAPQGSRLPRQGRLRQHRCPSRLQVGPCPLAQGQGLSPARQAHFRGSRRTEQACSVRLCSLPLQDHSQHPSSSSFAPPQDPSQDSQVA